MGLEANSEVSVYADLDEDSALPASSHVMCAGGREPLLSQFISRLTVGPDSVILSGRFDILIVSGFTVCVWFMGRFYEHAVIALMKICLMLQC